MALSITQGADRAIVISGIVDADGATLDVTGWTVRAQARANTGPHAPLLAEWVTGTPTGIQGQATASGDEVRLTVSHAMSSVWTWRTAVIQAEITEPDGLQRVERICDEELVIDPQIVRTS